jgi:hypothetical protein
MRERIDLLVVSQIFKLVLFKVILGFPVFFADLALA